MPIRVERYGSSPTRAGRDAIAAGCRSSEYTFLGETCSASAPIGGSRPTGSTPGGRGPPRRTGSRPAARPSGSRQVLATVLGRRPLLPPDGGRRRLGRPARPRAGGRGRRRARGQGQPGGRARAVRGRPRSRRRRRPRRDRAGARTASHPGTRSSAVTTEFTRGGKMATTDSTKALAHLWIHESPRVDLYRPRHAPRLPSRRGLLADRRAASDRYLDLCSSMWQAALGHGRSDIVEPPTRRQAEQIASAGPIYFTTEGARRAGRADGALGARRPEPRAS